MQSSDKFYVFSKWKDAPEHAFGSGSKASVVPREDKDGYNDIYDELMSAAAQAQVAGDNGISLKKMNWSRHFGSRGHRPVDLWVSLCGVGSQTSAQMPQIYAIASDRGLEIGFAASIDEADYHDPAVKARNRVIIPLLNARMPDPSEPLIKMIDQQLLRQRDWSFNSKTRLTPSDDGFGRFESLSEMVASLKASRSSSGGGAACRLFTLDQLSSLDLVGEFQLAVDNFLPLIKACEPSQWDVQILDFQDEVGELTEDVSFDPSTVVDARRLVLTEIARRQGQNRFRNSILKAYDGKCAITGTSVPSVLEAAHITPYLGQDTNHVTNGILLRADIHTLFDLRLLKIEPNSKEVRISEVLHDSLYAQYGGQIIADTVRPNQRPSAAALAKQFDDGPVTVPRSDKREG